MPDRPNILITIADDQRFDTIAAHGNAAIRTPCLDSLAARGTSFRRAQIPGSSHGAVCAPSRAMLHTGRGLYRCSDCLCEVEGPPTLERRADASRVLATLGSRLRDAGYDTFGVGKWHNQRESFARSFAGGSRIFFGGMCPHFCVTSCEFDAKHGCSESRMRAGHSTDQFAEAAVAYLHRRKNDERPFFLCVAFTAPHDPRETFARFKRMYEPDRLDVPPNFLPRHPFDLGSSGGRDEALAEAPRTEDDVRSNLADYYAMISHLDEGIGRVHHALEAVDQVENTIIVHTADHGLAVGQHGLMGKQNGYDHSIRVPLLVAGPGFEHGANDDRLCYMQDLFPTLTGRAGVDPDSSDFEDLQSSSPRSYITSAYMGNIRSVRDRTHKLITYDFNGVRKTTQLFDTVHDPYETRNLAGNHGPAGIMAGLSRALTDQMQATLDPFVDQFIESEAA